MRGAAPCDPVPTSLFTLLVDDAFRLREQKREAQYQKELRKVRARLRRRKA